MNSKVLILILHLILPIKSIIMVPEGHYTLINFALYSETS